MLAIKNVYLVGLTVALPRKKDIDVVGLEMETSIDTNNQGELFSTTTASLLNADKKALMKITYQAMFTHTFEKVDEKAVANQCTSLVFPYIREAVADISRRMPFEAPISLNLELGNLEIS
ncbi:MAG: hypothetical protein R3Y11_08485 [Pseudomonadota bacterium]